MLTAIRRSDGVKVIGPLIDKDRSETYYCPNPKCAKTVIHHKSDAALRIGHFAHKPGEAECPLRGEKLIHVRTKFDIYKYLHRKWGNALRIVEPEKYICNGKMRPDVYVETMKGTRIGIEVQASELTVDEIRRRTIQYEIEGVFVFWVLPFSFHRFFEKLSRRWDNKVYTFATSGYDDQWVPRQKVRLAAWEQFIYWCYLKKLTLWDIDHEHSDGFIVAELSDHVGEETTYYTSGGEEQYHPGRRSKTIKSVDRVLGEVPFHRFEPSVFKEPFQGKRLPYIIPARRVLLHRPERWKERMSIRLPEV